MREHAPLIGLVVAYAVLVAAALRGSPAAHLWRLEWHYPLLDVLFLGWAAGLAGVAYTKGRFAATFTEGRVAGAVLVWCLVPLLGDSFTSWKQAMWYLVPFVHDPWLHSLDVWMHGGRAPYAWLLPLLSTPALRLLDVVYALWFVLVMATIVGVAWMAPSVRRLQFLLSVALVWIVIGSALAAAAGSGGPCYYGRLVPGPDPYAALWQHLDATDAPPLIARRLQDDLWQWMEGRTWHAFGGISAMPSVHVAMATVVALAWASIGRLGAALGLLFVVLTQVGSVALGWHYAADGYVGAGAALVVWRTAGGLVRRVTASS
jgi:hypothetical protein